jgi:transposase
MAASKTKASPPANRPASKVVDDSIFDERSVVFADAAGIDIGSEKHYVSVAEDRASPAVRTFGCFTTDINEMADWLTQCNIHHVVLESTGVYWIPTYQILTDRGFDVRLVDAHHAKNVPGRKTDVWDARWLRKLHTFGLLQGCFMPPKEVEEIRACWRHRANLLQSLSQHTLRMQKCLDQMNLHLHKVISDTTGVTGLRIIRAIVAGERDPATLASLRMEGVKHTEETFIKALTGNYQPEYIFILKQELACYDFFRSQIKECDQQLQECLAAVETRTPPTPPNAPARTDLGAEEAPKPRRVRPSKNAPEFDLHSELVRIAGVDITKIDGVSTMTFQTVLSECGPDLQSRFATEKHFGSWMGLSPNHQITGGRIHKRRTRKVKNRVAQALRVAASTLHHSKSALGAYYRRLQARVGAPKAITATGYKIARLIWRMFTYGTDYVDEGQAAYEKKVQERSLKALVKRATAMGYTLISSDTGEVLAPAA